MSTIESVLNETRVFPPSADVVAKATLKPQDYERMCNEAREDYSGFWGRLARENMTWHKPFTQTLDFSRPGKPTDNAFIESLNGKFRPECLNAHWFMSLDDARAKCEAWRRDYNEVRPHSGIGNKPPASLVKSVSGTRPTPTE